MGISSVKNDRLLPEFKATAQRRESLDLRIPDRIGSCDTLQRNLVVRRVLFAVCGAHDQNFCIHEIEIQCKSSGIKGDRLERRVCQWYLRLNNDSVILENGRLRYIQAVKPEDACTVSDSGIESRAG